MSVYDEWMSVYDEWMSVYDEWMSVYEWMSQYDKWMQWVYARIWMVIVNVGVKGCQNYFVTLPCKLLCVTIYNFCIRLFENELKQVNWQI